MRQFSKYNSNGNQKNTEASWTYKALSIEIYVFQLKGFLVCNMFTYILKKYK